MTMNRISKYYNISKRTSLVKILLLLTAGVFLCGVAGCATQSETYSPQPVVSQADGLSSAGYFRAVLIEDMDNDGRPDIVGGASSPGMVTINYGDGQGGISRSQNLPVRGDVRSVAVADINEDGLADIIFTVQNETTGIKVWLNQSKRQWKPGKGPIEINRYEGLKTADVNGDGHMDIVAANATSDTQGGIQVWLGDGKGNWPIKSGPTINGIYMDALPVDLNQDGNLDIIGAGWGTYGALRVWWGDGTGNWSSAVSLEEGNFYGLDIGDLNKDGNFDIFAGSYRKGIRIFLGDGRGNFSSLMSPEEYLARKAKNQPNTASGVGKDPAPKKYRSFWKVLAVDLDEDGQVDIVAGSLDAEGIKAWRNRGKGHWSRFEEAFPSTGNYYEMVVGDLNADEHMDICAASFGEGIKIWPGKEGAFKIVQQHQVDELKTSERWTGAKATLENNVFKVINGVAEYKIDPGDTLEVTLWEGTTPKREEILVRPDGKISFGFVEDLSVKGLTPSQLDNMLTNNFKEYVKNPRIDVVVSEYDSKFVKLVGAIANNGLGTGSGQYALKGKTTALELLTRAGGATQHANLRNVRIRSKNGQSISLNLYKAILEGDLSQNPILDDGDLLFFPTLTEVGNRVFVFGEVNKPGAVTFANSETGLLDVLSEAGGATINAAEYETRIVRGDPTQPEIITANLRSLVEQGDRSQNVALVNGDIIYVPRSGIGDVNRFIEQIFPTLRAIATAASIVVNFDTINTIRK